MGWVPNAGNVKPKIACHFFLKTLVLETETQDYIHAKYML